MTLLVAHMRTSTKATTELKVFQLDIICEENNTANSDDSGGSTLEVTFNDEEVEGGQ